MVGPLPERLRDLRRFGGFLTIRCRKCGRKATYTLAGICDWFSSQNMDDDWRSVARRFYCQVCGAYAAAVTYSIDAPAAPAKPPRPARSDPPPGIDPERWAAADERERKRIMRQMRS